jgi:hypothetical protein
MTVNAVRLNNVMPFVADQESSIASYLVKP